MGKGKPKVNRRFRLGYLAPGVKRTRKIRRVDAILRIGEIDDWCKDADVVFERFNNNQQWNFTTSGGKVFYWPSTGRIVDDEKFGEPKIGYAWDDLLKHLAERFW